MAATESDLYRAIPDGSVSGPLVADGYPAPGVLYPRFEEASYFDRAGVERTAPAEVAMVNLTTGREVTTGGGTGMFDVDGWYGHGDWRYFQVPDGTECPDSLKIRREPGRRTNKAGTASGRFYQIEPRTRMTVEAYKGALDNLARAAVVRQVMLARSR